MLSSFSMSELQWIRLARKLFAYCSHLLEELEQLQDQCEILKKEFARLKSLVDKQETLLIQHGSYDTVH